MSDRGPGRGRLRPVAGGWQGDWKDAQGRRRRRFLATSRADAERMLTKLMRERDLEFVGMAGESGAPLAFDVLVENYLADLGTRAKPRAVKEARAMLERLRSELDARTVRSITRPVLTRWRLSKVAAGMAHKTANNHLATLGAALNHALRLGLIVANPIAGLRALPVTAEHLVRKPRALTEDEIERLLAVAAEADLELVRGRHCRPGARLPFPREPLLRTLLATGARWGELVATRWADLDVERATLTLRAETTKTRVERVIPVDLRTLASILSLRSHTERITTHKPHPSSPIFLSPTGKPWRDAANFRKHLHELYTRAGIAHRDDTGKVTNVHCLRHSACTRMIRAGAPVQLVQKVMGHKSLAMTLAVYNHLRLEDLRDALVPLPESAKPETRQSRDVRG